MAMRMDRKIKSFAVCISNAEAVACLDDAMAGRLFKALFDYASSGTVPKWSDKALTAVFKMFKSQVDRNAEAYREKCAKNAANASRRGKAVSGAAVVSETATEATVGSGGRRNATEADDGQRTPAVANGRWPNGDNYKINYNHKLKIEEDEKEETVKEENPGKKDDVANAGNGDTGTGIRYQDVPVAMQQAEEAFAVQKENGAAHEEAPGNLSFRTVWRMYGKPVGNAVWLERQWNALPDADKEAILRYVPLYVAERPDPKYRKNFSNFLAERTWETKPITPAAYGKYGQQDNGTTATGVRARDDATDLTEELIARCGNSGGGSV